MSKGKGWIDVKTSKRSYSAKGNARIPWERDEKVVSIEAHDDKDDKDKAGGKGK
jgi:hypothetical protein